MTIRVLPYGEQALLAEVADPEPDSGPGSDVVLGLAALAADLPGVREVVPAARTVLVVLDRPADLANTAAALRALRPEPPDGSGVTGAGREAVVLDVRYDGPDLAATAAELDLDTDALVRAHSAADYVVAFCGFAPGFAYLSGLPGRLHVPRRAEPRARVEPGSVGIAGEYSGVYPAASPGGWRLLGHTDAALWDVGRDPPALLAPGTPVRFRPVPP